MEAIRWVQTSTHTRSFGLLAISPSFADAVEDVAEADQPRRGDGREARVANYEAQPSGEEQSVATGRQSAFSAFQGQDQGTRGRRVG